MIIVLALIGLVVLFIIQNVVVVEIRFIFWSLEMSRSSLIFLMLAVGVIIGWFLHEYVAYKKSTGRFAPGFKDSQYGQIRWDIHRPFC